MIIFEMQESSENRTFAGCLRCMCCDTYLEWPHVGIVCGLVMLGLENSLGAWILFVPLPTTQCGVFHTRGDQ